MKNDYKLIAEIGVNHDGEYQRCQSLALQAWKLGADIVKFQIFFAEELVSPRAPLAAYQKKTGAKNQLDMLKSLEISPENWIKVFNFCKSKKIKYTASVFGTKSLDLLLSKTWPEFIKLGSGEINNIPLIEAVAKTQFPILVSTGLAENREITEFLKIVKRIQGAKNRAELLYCESKYPCHLDDFYFPKIEKLKSQFKVPVGFSDHSMTNQASLIAYSLGCRLIERHFTDDQSRKGPDHLASLSPDRFRELKESLDQLKKSLDRGEDKLANFKMKKIAKRSLHVVHPVQIGEIFRAENLVALRPGDGMPPTKIKKLTGRRSPKNYQAGDKIKDFLK